MAAPQRHQATSTPSSLLPETQPLRGVEALAGAVANALMQSFSSATQNLARDSTRGVDAANASTRDLCTGNQTRHCHQEEHCEHFSQSSDTTLPPSTYELAAGMRQHKRPRLTFEPPSLFESERRGRNRRSYGSISSCGTAGNSRSIRRATDTVQKAIQYSRNVMLLPPQYKSSNGEVLIPRQANRRMLGQAGLVGRVELLSTMTDLEVRQEICEVFSTPMGLSSADLKSDQPFPFTYLQNSGTHSYCVPSVNRKFEWNGKQVASLAKAGAYIYLLADAELPGYQALVS